LIFWHRLLLVILLLVLGLFCCLLGQQREPARPPLVWFGTRNAMYCDSPQVWKNSSWLPTGVALEDYPVVIYYLPDWHRQVVRYRDGKVLWEGRVP